MPHVVDKDTKNVHSVGYACRYNELKERVLRYCKKAWKPGRLTMYIHGHPGIGKSYMIAEVAQELDMVFVDLRAGMMADASDIKGLPKIVRLENGELVAKYVRPSELPAKGSKRCLLFVDELNRGRPDVLQGFFQLVLDHKVGEYVFPDNSVIIAAGNLGDEDGNTVTDMGTAFDNRFSHYQLMIHKDDVLGFQKKMGVKAIPTFLESKPEYILQLPKDEWEKSYPSPRSWMALWYEIDDELSKEKPDLQYIMGAAWAHVGFFAAEALHKFLKNRVKITPEDILNDLKKVEGALKNETRESIYEYNNSLLEHVKGVKKLTKTQVDNLVTYVDSFVEQDHAKSFVNSLAEISAFQEHVIKDAKLEEWVIGDDKGKKGKI